VPWVPPRLGERTIARPVEAPKTHGGGRGPPPNLSVAGWTAKSGAPPPVLGRSVRRRWRRSDVSAHGRSTEKARLLDHPREDSGSGGSPERRLGLPSNARQEVRGRRSDTRAEQRLTQPASSSDCGEADALHSVQVSTRLCQRCRRFVRRAASARPRSTRRSGVWPDQICMTSRPATDAYGHSADSSTKVKGLEVGPGESGTPKMN
jgi:hypothetical protein